MTLHSAEHPIISTTQGLIQGKGDGTVFEFLDIPYAQGIAGKNRFLPPQAVTAWSDVLHATQYANTAPQQAEAIHTPVTAAFAAPPEVQVGDHCLALNIWTPAQHSGKLAVMVWLHGGGWTSGSGSCGVYHGANLARRGDVIVVTLNHRLGLLGFTDLSRVVGGDYRNSTNLGMQDIVAALKWIQQHIAAFGGDPDCITIFGESGGGWKVSTLLAMPIAEGLFQRAIIQSGPLTQAMSYAHADQIASAVLTALRVDPSAPTALEQLSIEQINAAEKQILRAFPMTQPGFPQGFWPVLHAEQLPQHPFEPQAAASSLQVPLLIGQNATEFSLFMLADQAAYTLDATQLTQRVVSVFGEDAPQILACYQRDFPNASPSEHWFLIYSDYIMGSLSAAIADARSVEGAAPVYAYRFNWHTPIHDGQLYSPHTIEIPFVFNNALDRGLIMTGGGAEVQALAETVSNAWVTFAKTGHPAADTLPEWSAYQPNNRASMHLNTHSQIQAYLAPELVGLFRQKLWNNA